VHQGRFGVMAQVFCDRPQKFIRLGKICPSALGKLELITNPVLNKEFSPVLRPRIGLRCTANGVVLILAEALGTVGGTVQMGTVQMGTVQMGQLTTQCSPTGSIAPS
jgi:hypothetical protein